MRTRFVIPAIAAGLFLLAGCDIEEMGGGFERYNEDFHFNYPLKSGGRLAVDGFNGSIEVTVWDQETVDISGTKYARSQDYAHDLKIEIDHPGIPSPSVPSAPPTATTTAASKFAIKVPRGIRLDHLVTSNGAIRASDAAGPRASKTSNGSIEMRNIKGAAHRRDQQFRRGPHRYRWRRGYPHLQRPRPRPRHSRRLRRHHLQQQHSRLARSGRWRRAPAEFQRLARSHHAARRTDRLTRPHQQ